jgi:N-acetylglucosamine-6-sulfatase
MAHTDHLVSDGSPLNVLVVVADDQQAMGSVRRAMPYLASRPAGGWTTFRRATAATPLCGPSRATILTGQHAHQHGVVDNDGSRLDDSNTLATWLHDAGYRTGLVGKYINRFPFGGSAHARPGWDAWRVFTEVAYHGYTITRDASGRRQRPSTYSTSFLTRAAVRFLRAADPRPFFLLVGYNAPHAPATPAPPYENEVFEFGDAPNFNEDHIGDKPAYIRGLPLLSELQALLNRLLRQSHYRALRSIDDGVAAMITALDVTGRLDRTLIVYVGDNGYSFGAHRWERKRVPYDESARVPLRIRLPGSADKAVMVPASTVDLAATIVDTVGITPGRDLAGESLLPIVNGSAATMTRDAALISFRAQTDDLPRYWGLRTETEKYVEYGTGERELYDLSGDRWETVNRAGDPAWQERQAALAAKLADLKAGADD